MDNFQKSRSDRWLIGNGIAIDDEEHRTLQNICKIWGVPERIAAGIILRKALRDYMSGQEYVGCYWDRKNRTAAAQQKVAEEAKNGESGS